MFSNVKSSTIIIIIIVVVVVGIRFVLFSVLIDVLFYF